MTVSDVLDKVTLLQREASAFLRIDTLNMACRPVLCWLCLLLSMAAFSAQARSPDFSPLVDSSIEKVVTTQESDNFERIAAREFGINGLGRQLAEYNEMPYKTVFAKGVEIKVPISFKPRDDFAEAVFKKGEVLVYPGGSQQAAIDITLPFKVHVNDLIKTGDVGFVSLRFSSGTRVNIQPMSQVVVNKLSCLDKDDQCVVDLDAKAGGVYVDVENREKQPTQFIINTPYASAAVRGTVFDFDVSETEMLVGVTEGSVDIQSTVGEVSLPTGLGVKTVKDEGPQDPVPLLVGPRFANYASRITPEDTITWGADPKAAGYLLSLTEQPLGNREQYRESTSSTTHSIQQTESGAYFLNVRGLDSEGFKGYASSTELNVVTMNTNVAGPNLALDDADTNQRYVELVSADSELELFEIQFSTSPDFAGIVSVDVPSGGGAVAGFEGERYFARARAVLSETEVSRFGPVLEIAAN